MTEVVPPSRRVCERCGRMDVWNPDEETWVATESADESKGTPHCLHEWDINGTYNPFPEDD